MAVSNWFLYIGVFLCATGVGIVIGAIFIFYWGIKTLEESKVNHSYTENYHVANIDYRSDNGKTTPREYISNQVLEDGR